MVRVYYPTETTLLKRFCPPVVCFKLFRCVKAFSWARSPPIIRPLTIRKSCWNVIKWLYVLRWLYLTCLECTCMYGKGADFHSECQWEREPPPSYRWKDTHQRHSDWHLERSRDLIFMQTLSMLQTRNVALVNSFSDVWRALATDLEICYVFLFVHALYRVMLSILTLQGKR